MRKYKARKEREQLEAIVRPRGEIEDPSAELLSPTRSWERTDTLQDILDEQPDQPDSPQPPKDYHRVPRLKYRTKSDIPCTCQHSSDSQEDLSDDRDSNESTQTPNVDSPWENFINMVFEADPEVAKDITPTESATLGRTSVLRKQAPQSAAVPIPIRSRSLPPIRDIDTPLSVSLPKTNFLAFSQRCAPSPISASPPVSTPVFELAADEVMSPVLIKPESDAPSELEGSPVDRQQLRPAPLHVSNKRDPESEPEASPYNRFTTFVKSSHALNASLSTIAETEEEAASRRSSAQIFELPGSSALRLSAYSGGTSITPRCSRHMMGGVTEFGTGPARNISTRSTRSTNSTVSAHSMFSFEFSNSDSEKIYVSTPGGVRRESSAPSLTDVSSVEEDDDFDADAECETRRSRSIHKRDAKLERFFGIKQYSVGSESETSLNPTDANQPSSSETSSDGRASTNSLKPIRSPTSLDDLDLSLALENDPLRREIILMHKSILAKSQMKQDAKLEKFFGCGKAQIDVARKASTGSRLAGNTDDLKYRSIGW